MLSNGQGTGIRPTDRSALSALKELRALNLPRDDFAVFGSGPLIVRGVIPATNDIDVICRGVAWERVAAIGEKTYLPKYRIEIVSMDQGRLTFGTSWAIGDFDVDELIDTAEVIDGLPFVRLEHVVAYKRIANREKDREHLKLLSRSRWAV